MSFKLSKIVGITKEDFDKSMNEKDHNGNRQFNAQRASLIPFGKIGDEVSLSSVFMSSLKLIKEFRNEIFSNIKMPKNGKIYTYTEVEFSDNKALDSKDSRIDGLVILVQKGIIKDAALVEIKNGKNTLEKDQIERYLNVAAQYSIPRLVTISNEYVSNSNQSPLKNIKPKKNVDLYHLSWPYLLTIGNILLLDNNMNIADEDQVNIMEEVVNYFNHSKSGIDGFTRMKRGWRDTIEKINSGSQLNPYDKNTIEAVESWHQEERNLSLSFSRKLGVFVKSGNIKYKNDLNKRIEDDVKTMVNKKSLESTYKIENAISDIKVTSFLDRRNVSISVTLKAPTDKSLRGQLGWIKKQLKRCTEKSKNSFESIANEIFIEALLKNTSLPAKKPLRDIDQFDELLKGKEVREFNILQIKDFGKNIANPEKFIEVFESMAINFYDGVVQNLSKWEAPAPKLMSKKENIDTQDKMLTSSQDLDTIIEPDPCSSLISEKIGISFGDNKPEINATKVENEILESLNIQKKVANE